MKTKQSLLWLLSLLMLAVAPVFTACSDDDDKSDPNVIIAGENDPLGTPIGLVYTDFITANDVIHNADTTETHVYLSPNPASDRMTLRLSHNLKSAIAAATVTIFDSRGSCVASFTPAVGDNSYIVGPVEWTLGDGNGQRVSPGIYIVRFVVTTVDGDKICDTAKAVVR